MILCEIRDYLKVHRRAALADMALHFHADRDALRGMLGTWVAKGKVKELPTGAVCEGGCCRCDPSTTGISEWKG